MYIASAPLQGYTDAIYRQAHHECVGGVDEYYTPFVRVEKGEVRRKDLRDTDPERNAGVPTVPQVIANGGDEFARLCDALQQQGWRRIDLNMGCPFPMQVRAGRGSGLLSHPDRVEEILREMQRRPEVVFSAKMRTGWESVDEGLSCMNIINAMPLLHVTLHPRLGRQQYKGTPDLEAFARFLEACRHPMVYNGDIMHAECGKWEVGNVDGTDISALFPDLKGVMLGRGLLARPWITACAGGTPAHPVDAGGAPAYQFDAGGTPAYPVDAGGTPACPVDAGGTPAYPVDAGGTSACPVDAGETPAHPVLRSMHVRIYRHATETLCGESQMLSHLHAFWEYIEIPHKQKKAIMKASTLPRYREAVASALSVVPPGLSL